MILTSALKNIHTEGFFGDYENKPENDLLKLSENKNLLIIQIVKYKNSSISTNGVKIDNLDLKNEAVSVSSNNDTRILWNGPNNWFLTSSKKELLTDVMAKFDDTNFAITDLSHSRAIIQIEGDNSKEVLKKGCPYNFNDLKKNNSINSTFNGISVTIDMINDSPYKIRVYTLRSFGESLYHSITDSCLEFGYKSI